MIVWRVGTSSDNTGNDGDQRLHGYDGDTGAVVYGGGGVNELMAYTHKWRTTGIVARGRIYVAGANKVYAFKVPGGTPTPTPTATPVPTATPTLHQLRLHYHHRHQHLLQLRRQLLRRHRHQRQPQAHLAMHASGK